jgi:hypothetical protein
VGKHTEKGIRASGKKSFKKIIIFSGEGNRKFCNGQEIEIAIVQPPPATSSPPIGHVIVFFFFFGYQFLGTGETIDGFSIGCGSGIGGSV